MLGPPKLPKIDQDAKKKVPNLFFDGQEAKKHDFGPLPRRRPQTGSPEAWILEAFGSIFDHFLKKCCFTFKALHGTQKVQ